MGYMRHHGMLVTTFDKEKAEAAHQKAREIFTFLVSEIRESVINGYYSFAIFPDGSKEDWDDSDLGDGNRAFFKAWLETQRHEDRRTSLDWVEVQYGDDDWDTKIIADSDALLREQGYKDD